MMEEKQCIFDVIQSLARENCRTFTMVLVLCVRHNMRKHTQENHLGVVDKRASQLLPI